MNHFIAELGEISLLLPPLFRAAVVLIAGMAVWIVLSVPAFWICRTLGVSIHPALERLTLLHRKLFSFALKTIENCAAPIDKFIISHAQMFSFSNENSQIRLEIAKVRSAVEGIPTKIQALESSVVDAGNKFSGAAEWITNLEVPNPITPPGAQEFSAVQKGRNKAVVILIAAIFVTPPLIVFNTFMLSQFLEGFSQGTELAGVPLSMLLAGFMTMVEIALGVLHAWTQNPKVQLIWIAGILGLAFVECTFYALMGQGFNRSLFDAFYAPNPAPEWTKDWFGIFGPILVSGLAGMGHALFSSISQLAETNVIRQWRTYIEKRMSSAKELRERLSDADRAKGLLLSSLTDVRSSLDATADAGGSNIAIIERAKEDLQAQVKKAESIRLEDTRRLDRGAMMRLFIESLIFSVAIGIALATLASIYSTAIITSPHLTLTGWWLGGAIALAEGVVLLIAGSATSRANATLPASDGIPAISLPTNKVGLFAGFGILCICGSETRSMHWGRSRRLMAFCWAFYWRRMSRCFGVDRSSD